MWNDIILILDGTLMISIPFIFAAMGGIFAERSGVIDFGLEGKMLGGAFVAATVAHWSQSAWWGLFGSICIGILFSLISFSRSLFNWYGFLNLDTSIQFLYFNSFLFLNNFFNFLLLIKFNSKLKKMIEDEKEVTFS